LFASAIIKAVTLLPLARWGIAALPYSMMHASSFGVGRFLEHGFNWDATKDLSKTYYKSKFLLLKNEWVSN